MLWIQTLGYGRPETTTDILFEGMFRRVGASDQDRNFKSRHFTVLCERLGMQKTTPSLPQSDDLVERFNLTVKQ